MAVPGPFSPRSPADALRPRTGEQAKIRSNTSCEVLRRERDHLKSPSVPMLEEVAFIVAVLCSRSFEHNARLSEALTLRPHLLR